MLCFLVKHYPNPSFTNWLVHSHDADVQIRGPYRRVYSRLQMQPICRPIILIATGFNIPKSNIEEVSKIKEDESFKPPKTNQLQEVENKPLHAQKEIDQKENVDSEKVITFDDTSDSPVIYGKDLQIPAFIRRRHD